MLITVEANDVEDGPDMSATLALLDDLEVSARRLDIASLNATAALRAAEMNCEALLKGTQVDGVYTSDPKTDPNAERFEHLSYLDVLSQDLRVMDASAISLARENNIPILVFSIHNSGAFADVLSGRGRFTLISDER